jgi:hypothetical protein
VVSNIGFVAVDESIHSVVFFPVNNILNPIGTHKHVMIFVSPLKSFMSRSLNRVH